MTHPINERPRPRLPEPAQVYALGHYEQQVIAQALGVALEQTDSDALAFRTSASQLLNIFGTAGTVTLIKHQDGA